MHFGDTGPEFAAMSPSRQSSEQATVSVLDMDGESLFGPELVSVRTTAQQLCKRLRSKGLIDRYTIATFLQRDSGGHYLELGHSDCVVNSRGAELTQLMIVKHEVPEEKKELLFECRVSTETLQHWASEEAQISIVRLVRHVPWLALDFIYEFLFKLCTMMCGDEDSCQLQVARIFQVYRHKDDPPLEALMGAAAAVVGLVRKFQIHDTIKNRPGMLASQLAAKASEAMTDLFQTPSIVTAEDVIKHDNLILEAIGWKPNLPSVYTWLGAICMRFKVMIPVAAVHLVVDRVLQLSTNDVMSHFAYLPYLQFGTKVNGFSADEIAPRNLAIGYFILNLIAEDVISLDSMRPEAVAAEDWHDVFVRSQQRPSRGRATGTLLDEANLPLLPMLLELILDCSMADLQADAHAAALVHSMVHDITNARNKSVIQGHAQNATVVHVTI